MTEPAELLLIRDQYELAFHSLSRGLTAEEAGNRAESLVYYRKGRQHLTQGLEVPTGAERQQGPVWDKARLLQQRMRDTVRTVDAHLSDLETSQLTTEDQRRRLLMDLPPNLYPDLAPSSQPPQSSLHHLYPTVPTTTQSTTPTPAPSPKVPPRPQSPAVLPTHTLPAPAPKTIAMANSGDQPPAYTPRPTLGHRSLSHSFGPRIQTGETGGGDGNELLFIPSGVQIFFVAPNGQVSSLSHPGFLRIITLASHQKGSTAGRPSAFLHVCDWMYPLTRDVPVLLATSGIYMFPDTLSETSGSYVGIVLSSELPAVQRDTFQDLISQLAELRVQDPTGTGSEVINLSEKVPLGPTNGGLAGERNKPLPGWSEKMAQGIMTGATRLSVGFVKGAEATGRAIHKGAAKIRDHITPEETPSEVSPNVTKGLNATKQVTGGALRVSQFLVNGVSTVVGHVADKMAPHVKKQGAKLVPESLKNSKDGGPSNWDGAKFVAASSVQGFSTVWASLETGAKLVGKSVATETVNTMTYKYGNDAGEATDTAVKSVVNIGVTAYNIDNLGLKAILKSAGKKTAKAMAKGSGEQPPQSEEKEGKEGKEGNEGKEGKEAQKRELEAETHGKEKQKKEEEENEK